MFEMYPNKAKEVLPRSDWGWFINQKLINGSYTKKDALMHTCLVWREVSAQLVNAVKNGAPAVWLSPTALKQSAIIKVFGEPMYFDQFCPCCAYENQMREKMDTRFGRCEFCPLLREWTKDGIGTCTSPYGTPYTRFTKSVDRGYYYDAAFFALLIAEMAERKMREFKTAGGA